MVYQLRWLLFKLYRSVKWSRLDIKVCVGSHVAYGTTIGKRTRVNAPSFISNCSIGSYCALAGRLIVRDSNHYTNYANMQDWTQKEIIKSSVSVVGKKESQVRVGNGVWIGDSVIILPSVVIGHGAVVGAGSVVTKSIPPYAVAVGNPARVIKYRFSGEIIDILLDIAWWKWSDTKIEKNTWFFELDLETISGEELHSLLERKLIL